MNWLNLNKNNFGFVKYFAYLAGIWPYHTTKERYFYGGLVATILSCVLILPETLASFMFRDDPEALMDSIDVAFINIMSITKFLINIYNHKTIRNLFDQARRNLTTCTTAEEYNILQDYTKLGDVLSHGWTGIVYMGTVVYSTEPLITTFLSRLISNNNDTVPLKFAVPLYLFGIDTEANFYPIFIISGILIFGIMNIAAVSDSMFIALLNHASGLFAVTGHMMNNIPTEKDLKNRIVQKNSSLTLENIQYEYYVNCIKKHKRAIKFANDLETTYVWCFGVVTLVNVPLMSLTVTQITFQASNFQEIIKYTIFGTAQLIHLFFDCFLSQQLINSSLMIQESVVTGNWYATSPKVQKLITLITLRSQLPCKLTAGKVAILSLETFTTFVKTAGSYFTVLTSMQ